MVVRVGWSAVAGLAAGACAGVWLAWPPASLLGWDAAAACFLLWTWIAVVRLDPDDTRRHAEMENPSRKVVEAVVLVSGVALLAAVGLLLIEAGRSHGATKAFLVAIGVSSVVLSWATVHTVFLLRYARCYYEAADGSVDFHEDSPPDYRDFAYLAFTVGMTFQVSDTDLLTKPMRRLVIGHALLSFLYGAVILALAINVVASLLSSH